MKSLSDKEENIYISLAFSETEHLIALTGMPSYKIQIWYWRTHEMLVSQDTEMITDKQKITCSSSLPLTVAQFARKSGKLVVWEVHGTQKFCKLIKRNIQLDFAKTDGPFQDVYSIDGNIQIVNKHGDVYYVIPSSGSINLIAKWNGGQGDFTSCVAFIRNGILVSGPDGTFKYFKRQKYVWNEIFQSSTPDPFVSLKGFHDNESAIGSTFTGDIHKLNLLEGDKLNISKVKSYDPAYEFFALINPLGEYLIAVDSSNRIHVMLVKSGDKVAMIPIERQTVTQSNPRFPLIAVGNISGDVTFVSLLHPASPLFLSEFYLSRRSITKMQFSDCGRYLVVVDEDVNFFIIRSVPGDKMIVMHHFKENSNILKYFVIGSDEKLDIFFLCSSVKDSSNVDSLMKITANFNDHDNVERKEWALSAAYSSIFSIPGNSMKLYAVRHGVRYIEVLRLEGDAAVLFYVIETPHQLRHIEGYNDGNHLVTWSIDGIAAAYDVNNKHELLVAFAANNRNNFGTKMAQCDGKCKLMVTLDQAGNLICSSLNVKKLSEAREKFDDKMAQSKIEIFEMFARSTSGGFPGTSIENIGKKFTDLKSEQTYQMEARESEQTRKILFAKLDTLRAQVKKLLDENEEHEDDEKLQIQDFNLNLITTAMKEQEAKSDRDQEEKKMMDYIEAQTAMNNWIISKCWNPMEVKGTKVRGMFISLFIDNYPLLAEISSRQLQRIKLMRSIENSVAREDAFLPWRPIPTM